MADSETRTMPNALHEGLHLDLRKRQGTFLTEAALTTPGRGVTALFGPSGSGKTTLLRLIAGLDRPDAGVIRLGGEVLSDARSGRHVPPHRRRLGVVFQEARLFPHYRVRGNLTYGMPAGATTSVDDIVALLGIGQLLERFPATLSGGEARRVAIGRALLSQPRLLLMDEPLTGLDGARKQELLHYIARLTRRIDIPVIYVSHDPEELVSIADRLALLDQGRVLTEGPLDDVLTRLEFGDALGGFDAVSLLTARIESHDTAFALTRLRLADGQPLVVPAIDRRPGDSVRLRVPVRDISLALITPTPTSDHNRLEVVIERIARSTTDAATVDIGLRLGEARLRARLTRHACHALGLREGMAAIAVVRNITPAAG